jgi:beta-mannosidase
MIQWLLVVCLLSQAATETPLYQVTELAKNWEMNLLEGPENISPLKAKVYKTSIPTTVHLDLLAAKDIPDPFIKENYPGVKWISDCTARYALNFSVDEATFSHTYQQLVFEGIDTYADIRLNKVSILSTENAFRKYVVNVKQHLKKGENQLEVIINSTNARDNLGQQVNAMPFAYAHTRKACYQYSWDWAPFLNTLGIWKRVYLESYQEVKFDYVWVRTRAISKLKATLNFAVALEWPTKELEATYQVKVFHEAKEIAAFPAREKYSYHDVHIANPELWWPNGIGKPHIYDFVVKLIRFGPEAQVDERKIPFGIRTVELDKSNRKFEVKVNGYSVYCKGANYVPADMFYPRLENPAYTPGNTIESLFDSAVDSHFNMIRVWGGGQYESDKFLELASRKGIMLFYDFMFSDSIYPSTEKFLLNVEEEIKQQIRRARNYPALTLWSGNNEILQGINDWGWGRAEYKEDYRKLFEVLIPKIIEYESPYIPYIPSSPIYGVGNYGLDRGGDAHFWSVWAGGAEFESYIQNVGRFNSEFGTQGLPVWETIVEAIDNKPSYESNSMLLHERHNSRFGTLRNYMNSYMKAPINFEMETYQSGLLQAYAI